jgi:small subunit ribosomal protein S18
MRDNFGSRDSEFGGGKKDFNKKRKPRRPMFRRKRPPANMTFDYKDVHTLMMFLTEEGRIVPGRVSGLSAAQQRQLTLAVKRARHLSLISPVRRESVH